MIIDDDWRVREALAELLSTFDFETVTFGSIAEYVAHPRADVPSCLILDVKLPDISGLDFQAEQPVDQHPPIVFITGHGDIPSSVRAIKRGAVDFLTKPLIERDLVKAIRTGVERDRAERRARAELAELQGRLNRLTPRERQVLALVVSGLLNKQAAAKLGITESTVQIHRRRIMEKMKATSLADLVRIAVTLGA
ncbi:MAG TPA: response regulator [Polyangiales bacterium]|nr:response regulator [Polyangiales bacterium]